MELKRINYVSLPQVWLKAKPKKKEIPYPDSGAVLNG